MDAECMGGSMQGCAAHSACLLPLTCPLPIPLMQTSTNVDSREQHGVVPPAPAVATQEMSWEGNLKTHLEWQQAQLGVQQQKQQQQDVDYVSPHSIPILSAKRGFMFSLGQPVRISSYLVESLGFPCRGPDMRALAEAGNLEVVVEFEVEGQGQGGRREVTKIEWRPPSRPPEKVTGGRVHEMGTWYMPAAPFAPYAGMHAKRAIVVSAVKGADRGVRNGALRPSLTQFVPPVVRVLLRPGKQVGGREPAAAVDVRVPSNPPAACCEPPSGSGVCKDEEGHPGLSIFRQQEQEETDEERREEVKVSEADRVCTQEDDPSLPPCVSEACGAVIRPDQALRLSSSVVDSLGFMCAPGDLRAAACAGGVEVVVEVEVDGKVQAEPVITHLEWRPPAGDCSNDPYASRGIFRGTWHLPVAALSAYAGMFAARAWVVEGVQGAEGGVRGGRVVVEDEEAYAPPLVRLEVLAKVPARQPQLGMTAVPTHPVIDRAPTEEVAVASSFQLGSHPFNLSGGAVVEVAQEDGEAGEGGGGAAGAAGLEGLVSEANVLQAAEAMEGVVRRAPTGGGDGCGTAREVTEGHGMSDGAINCMGLAAEAQPDVQWMEFFDDLHHLPGHLTRQHGQRESDTVRRGIGKVPGYIVSQLFGGATMRRLVAEEGGFEVLVEVAIEKRLLAGAVPCQVVCAPTARPSHCRNTDQLSRHECVLSLGAAPHCRQGAHQDVQFEHYWYVTGEGVNPWADHRMVGWAVVRRQSGAALDGEGRVDFRAYTPPVLRATLHPLGPSHRITQRGPCTRPGAAAKLPTLRPPPLISQGGKGCATIADACGSPDLLLNDSVTAYGYVSEEERSGACEAAFIVHQVRHTILAQGVLPPIPSAIMDALGFPASVHVLRALAASGGIKVSLAVEVEGEAEGGVEPAAVVDATLQWSKGVHSRYMNTGWVLPPNIVDAWAGYRVRSWRVTAHQRGAHFGVRDGVFSLLSEYQEPQLCLRLSIVPGEWQHPGSWRLAMSACAAGDVAMYLEQHKLRRLVRRWHAPMLLTMMQWPGLTRSAPDERQVVTEGLASRAFPQDIDLLLTLKEMPPAAGAEKSGPQALHNQNQQQSGAPKQQPEESLSNPAEMPPPLQLSLSFSRGTNHDGADSGDGTPGHYRALQRSFDSAQVAGWACSGWWRLVSPPGHLPVHLELGVVQEQGRSWGSWGGRLLCRGMPLLLGRTLVRRLIPSPLRVRRGFVEAGGCPLSLLVEVDGVMMDEAINTVLEWNPRGSDGEGRADHHKSRDLLSWWQLSQPVVDAWADHGFLRWSVVEPYDPNDTTRPPCLTMHLSKKYDSGALLGAGAGDVGGAGVRPWGHDVTADDIPDFESGGGDSSDSWSDQDSLGSGNGGCSEEGGQGGDSSSGGSVGSRNGSRRVWKTQRNPVQAYGTHNQHGQTGKRQRGREGSTGDSEGSHSRGVRVRKLESRPTPPLRLSLQGSEMAGTSRGILGSSISPPTAPVSKPALVLRSAAPVAVPSRLGAASDVPTGAGGRTVLGQDSGKAGVDAVGAVPQTAEVVQAVAGGSTSSAAPPKPPSLRLTRLQPLGGGLGGGGGGGGGALLAGQQQRLGGGSRAPRLGGLYK